MLYANFGYTRAVSRWMRQASLYTMGRKKSNNEKTYCKVGEIALDYHTDAKKVIRIKVAHRKAKLANLINWGRQQSTEAINPYPLNDKELRNHLQSALKDELASGIFERNCLVHDYVPFEHAGMRFGLSAPQKTEKQVTWRLVIRQKYQTQTIRIHYLGHVTFFHHEGQITKFKIDAKPYEVLNFYK